MEVKDLQPNQGNVDLVLTIVDKSEPRTFEKFGKQGRVCNCKVKDDTGEVKMTLWNEDVDKVKVGDKIHLKNGWCSEYQGELQVSSGKFGELEVLSSGAEPQSAAAPPAEEKQAEPQPEEKKEESAPVEETLVTEEETIE